MCEICEPQLCVCVALLGASELELSGHYIQALLLIKPDSDRLPFSRYRREKSGEERKSEVQRRKKRKKKLLSVTTFRE